MIKWKKYLVLSFLVALFGEIYFYPLQNDLKFSAGVVAINVIILIVDDLNEFILSIFCGLTVFIMRDINGILFLDKSFADLIIKNLPSFLYYLMYGSMIILTKLKEKRENMFQVIMILALVDSFSNVFEATIRNNIDFNVVRFIVVAGILRSFTAYVIYSLYNRDKLFVLNSEHQKRYAQLNVLVSNIQAELFYLKKSMMDIEQVMGKSYDLYETYKDNRELKEKTLDIAREIHEIKKDYFRVIKGFDAFVKNMEDEDGMTLSNIFKIINDNTKRYLKENNKNIGISFHHKKDISLKSYYNLFAILNNLITNSIDACNEGNHIKVIKKEDDENIYFEVIDDGEGIEEEIIAYIFNPGFTTKYDDISGKASTGIGLSHVKNIVEELGGIISVESKVNQGTKFKIKLPKNALIG